MDSQPFQTIYVNDKYWDLFCESIQTSCYFSYPVTNKDESKGSETLISSINVSSRFYIKENIIYHHVTNDARRIICKHLKRYGYI